MCVVCVVWQWQQICATSSLGLRSPHGERQVDRWLTSVKPVLTAEEYEKAATEAKQFLKKDARKLQFYLKLKSW